MKQAPTDPEGIDQQNVQQLLVQHLYHQLPAALLASLGVAVVTIAVIIKPASLLLLTAWTFALLLVSQLRYNWYRQFNEAVREQAKGGIWQARYLTGTLLAGLVWGGLAWVLPKELPQEYLIFIVFILGGLLAGATQTSGALFASFLAFALPISVSIVVWLFSVDAPFPTEMAILIIFFALALGAIARNNSRMLRESFTLRFKNTELIDELTSAQAHSTQLVAKLKQEVVQRTTSQERLLDYNSLLEMLAHGAPLHIILNNINLMVERQLPGSMSSIMLLDERGGRLATASAPSLPQAYNDAVNDVAIGPESGSCGTAAFRNATTISEEIETDPLWHNFKQLALAHNLRACWSTPVRNAQGKPLGTLAVYHTAPHNPSASELELSLAAANIAGIAIEAKDAEVKLQRLAHHDQLTKLPNRAFLYDRLEFLIGQAQREEHRFALLFIDLDGFKSVNDTRGHETGDHLLQDVASRLRDAVRETDVPSRFGGDEFIILLTHLHTLHDPELVAEKILRTLQQPFTVDGQECRIGCSIGISIFPDDGNHADHLIQLADQAMYRAKQRGNCYTFHAEPVGLA